MLCTCVKTTKMLTVALFSLIFQGLECQMSMIFVPLLRTIFQKAFFMWCLLDHWLMLVSASTLFFNCFTFVYMVCYIVFRIFMKTNICRLIEKGSAAWGRDSCGADKTLHSQKSKAFIWKCCIFVQMLFSRAVRKGAMGTVNLTPQALREGMRF